LKLADVFLDTYPYNCGSTSNDVLNAGIPLVTLYGKTLVSRMGLSLLKSLQLDSLATSSYKNYKEKVLEVAEMSMVDELRININDGELFKISYIDK
jgi:predicted O-linked N-acetylglucosamine transferase (SPINDLY family)